MLNTKFPFCHTFVAALTYHAVTSLSDVGHCRTTYQISILLGCIFHTRRTIYKTYLYLLPDFSPPAIIDKYKRNAFTCIQIWEIVTNAPIISQRDITLTRNPCKFAIIATVTVIISPHKGVKVRTQAVAPLLTCTSRKPPTPPYL